MQSEFPDGLTHRETLMFRVGLRVAMLVSRVLRFSVPHHAHASVEAVRELYGVENPLDCAVCASVSAMVSQ